MKRKRKDWRAKLTAAQRKHLRQTMMTKNDILRVTEITTCLCCRAIARRLGVKP